MLTPQPVGEVQIWRQDLTPWGGEPGEGIFTAGLKDLKSVVIGVLFGCLGGKMEGDSWFTLWFNHLPGASICPKRTPMGVVRRLDGVCRFFGEVFLAGAMGGEGEIE